MSPKADTQKPAKRATATRKPSTGLTPEERAAMKDLMKERRAQAGRSRGKKGQADAEREVLAKIAEMPSPDRAMAERIHAIVKRSAPHLTPRTWYGMPAYAKEGNVVCFFQGAHKFKARYATLGFNDRASLDQGNMWPVAFALTKLTAAEEKKIVGLVKRAVS